MASYTGSSIFDIITTKYVPSTSSGQTDTFELTPGGALSNQQIAGVKIKTIYGDTTYTNASQASLFDDLSTNDAHMCVRIFHGNLTINASQTLQPTVRCRGLILFVKGNLTNNGTISMSTWGAPTATGQNVYLITNNNQMQYIPSAGGTKGTLAGLSGTSTQISSGTDGSASATARGTGGGGSGTAWMISSGTSSAATAGSGTDGTSYCGGFGGGSAHVRNASVTGVSASTSGGGAASINFSTTSGSLTTCGGGAGTAVGLGKSVTANTTTVNNNAGSNGMASAAGLLVVYCLGNFTNNLIESKGATGGQGNFGSGGSSGGGSVNVFHRGTGTAGTINVSKGASVTTTQNTTYKSGSGGDGYSNVASIVATVRQTLFKVGIAYYYYDGSAWQTASGATNEDKFRANGMLDGELLNLDKSKIAQLSGVDLSAVTIKTYVTT